MEDCNLLLIPPLRVRNCKINYDMYKGTFKDELINLSAHHHPPPKIRHPENPREFQINSLKAFFHTPTAMVRGQAPKEFDSFLN